MRDDLVTVIVPAHNAAATLERALRSALAQTHAALELVVVDDGSTDGTTEIIRRLAASDARVRALTQENRGVAAARNAALNHARGTLIAPLDADDLWHPAKIARQVAALYAAGPDTGLAYCHARQIDSHDRVVETWPTGHRGEDAYAELFVSNFIRCASIPLIRREALERAGGYDPGLREAGAQGCEDLKLYLRLAEQSRFVLCPEYLVGYRWRAGSMSAQTARMLRSWQLVMAEAQARRPDLPPHLIRWATGNFHRWLGFDALSRGRAAAGLALLGRALVRDPGGTVRPDLALTTAEILAARAARRLRLSRALRTALRRSRPGSDTECHAEAPLFLDCDPAHAGEPVVEDAQQRRRLAAAAATRLRPVGACGREGAP